MLWGPTLLCMLNEIVELKHGIKVSKMREKQTAAFLLSTLSLYV